MLVEELLRVLDDLSKADARLAGTAIGSVRRRAALREVRRLERIAFAGVLAPAKDARSERRGPGIIL
ncbi:MAG TPA: hypothetical protein VGK17_19950 [Propionicimonas sp.]|jgi:hypothetical protein